MKDCSWSRPINQRLPQMNTMTTTMDRTLEVPSPPSNKRKRLFIFFSQLGIVQLERV